MIQQNVTKFDVNHPWGRGEGDGLLPGARGAGPIGEIRVYLLKTSTQERLNRM